MVPGLEELKKTELPKIKKEIEEAFGLLSPANRFERLILEVLKDYTLNQEDFLRPVLTILGHRALEGDEEDVRKVAAAFHFLHASYHIQDDVVDLTEERKGRPSFWKRMKGELEAFGHLKDHFTYSIGFIGGNIAKLLAHRMVLEADIPSKRKQRILDLIEEVDLCANFGEYGELVQTSLNPSALAEKDILRVYECLTRYWIYGALAAGALVAGENGEVYRDFGVPLGVAAQLINDLHDVFGEGARFDDIKEGRVSLLVWYVYHNGDQKATSALEKYFGRERLSERDKEEIRRIFIESGARDYVRERARELIATARDAIRELPIDPDYTEAFVDLTDLFSRELPH